MELMRGATPFENDISEQLGRRQETRYGLQVLAADFVVWAIDNQEKWEATPCCVGVCRCVSAQESTLKSLASFLALDIDTTYLDKALEQLHGTRS